MPSTSTEAYETLRSVVDSVQSALAAYINSNSLTVHPLLYPAERTTPHPFNPGLVIYSAEKPLRNVKLTQERVSNLIVSCHKVGDVLRFSSRMISDMDLLRKLLDIQAELQSGLARNLELSKTFNKKHYSYRQSLAAHKNFFSVYFNMTLFQSRATDVYERELVRLRLYLDASCEKLGKGTTLYDVSLRVGARARNI